MVGSWASEAFLRGKFAQLGKKIVKGSALKKLSAGFLKMRQEAVKLACWLRTVQMSFLEGGK